MTKEKYLYFNTSDKASLGIIPAGSDTLTFTFYKCMIALKVSRMAVNTKKDTMVDCVGYIAALDDYKNGGYDK